MELTGKSVVLVPVDLSAEATLSPGLVSLLEQVDVVLLGYYPTPAQTAPSQLRETKGEEAQRRLSAVAGQFGSSNGSLVTRIVFTHDRQDPIDRIAAQKSCDAVLIPGDGTDEPFARMLVPLRDRRNAERILAVAADLLSDADTSVTLFHVPEAADGVESGEALLATARDQLIDRGIGPSRIDTNVAAPGNPAAGIREKAEGFDLIVAGESEPVSRTNILGGIYRALQPTLTIPQIVVRRLDS
ncbi:universal stress protein [Halorubrum vacuolatum]|uniref:Nucleotide-binding universal stress protein, UspA family n=1 Tax=Halorubrum vacuolatum TaxID=63740 RepID=A0A238WYY4_HALVU|nr:universal stress protein [Halorubrum vacuolatum]SNR51628.1 hypothetical protein SAMN06264855_11162 [Halorubrum vacuolatum]